MPAPHVSLTSLHGNLWYPPGVVPAWVGLANCDLGVVAGQSNGNGTTARAGVDSVAFTTLFPGKTIRVRHQGAAWTQIAANTCGPLYRMLQRILAARDDVDIVRESINGAGEVSVRETQLGNILNSLSAISRTPSEVKVVFLIHGEEDNTTTALANNYRNVALERILRMYEATFVNAMVVVWTLYSDTYGADPQPATVRLAQTEAAARRPGVRKLTVTRDIPGMSLADSVHFNNASYDLAVDWSFDTALAA